MKYTFTVQNESRDQTLEYGPYCFTANKFSFRSLGSWFKELVIILVVYDLQNISKQYASLAGYYLFAWNFK